MEWKTVSTLLFIDRDKECEYLCVWTPRERGGGGKRKRRQMAQSRQSSETHAALYAHISCFLSSAKTKQPNPTQPFSADSAAPLATFCPASSLGPRPLCCSLLILPEHIVLFAFHVLKVKVAPGHALVDVLDVVASGLEVSGGIVGPWCKDLGEIHRQDWQSQSGRMVHAARFKDSHFSLLACILQ